MPGVKGVFERAYGMCVSYLERLEDICCILTGDIPHECIFVGAYCASTRSNKLLASLVLH